MPASSLVVEILKAINLFGPTAVELILIAREPVTGKVTVTSITEATDEQAKANLEQLREFFDSD